MRRVSSIVTTCALLAVLVDASRAQPDSTAAWGACRGALGSEESVRWIQPEREVDLFGIRKHCRTVGPPATFAPQRVDEVARTDSIVVVSWNIHVGGGDLVDFVARLRAGHWTQGTRIEHFVLLLQEVHRSGEQVPPWSSDFDAPDHIGGHSEDDERLDIIQAARQLGLHAFYAPSMRNGGANDPREDRGNAILSALPLSDLTVIELPFEGQRRAVVAATIQGTSMLDRSWSLRVYSVHLDAKTHGLRMFSSLGAGRVRQARFLVDNLNDRATVLGGDFNTWTTGPREPAISIVREWFPLPKSLSEGATLRRRVLYDPRVDYLFFRLAPQDDASYRRVDSRFDSDHNPLIATVPVLNLSP